MPDRIRWGILGTADIATELVRAIAASDNGQVAAVASRSEARARAWADEHGVPRAFGSYDELLDAGELVDAVYLPLPNSLHAEWTIRALEAGFPVLCEKPLAVDADQARQVAEVARRVGKPVAEGFMYRLHPLYERVGELIAAGQIGELTSLDAEFSFFLADRDAIPASAELAGGALMDVGCYCVHLARTLAGEQPERVGAFCRVRDGVDDSLVGLLDFPGGLLARFECSIASCERHRVAINGTRASLVLDDPWIPGLEDTSLRLCRWGQPDEVVAVPGADAYRLEVERFADICLGRIPDPGLADAVANMQVLDALLLAANDDRVVPVPSETD